MIKLNKFYNYTSLMINTTLHLKKNTDYVLLFNRSNLMRLCVKVVDIDDDIIKLELYSDDKKCFSFNLREEFFKKIGFKEISDC